MGRSSCDVRYFGGYLDYSVIKGVGEVWVMEGIVGWVFREVGV